MAARRAGPEHKFLTPSVPHLSRSTFRESSLILLPHVVNFSGWWESWKSAVSFRKISPIFFSPRCPYVLQTLRVFTEPFYGLRVSRLKIHIQVLFFYTVFFPLVTMNYPSTRFSPMTLGHSFDTAYRGYLHVGNWEKPEALPSTLFIHSFHSFMLCAVLGIQLWMKSYLSLSSRASWSHAFRK